VSSNGIVTHAAEAPVITRADGEALRHIWPWLRSKLEIVKHKALVSQRRQGLTRSYATWIPEHIRVAIIRGLANPPQNTVELWLVNSQVARADGFFITSCPFDEFIQVQLTLFIWIGYSERAGLLEKCEPFVDRLALDRGCIQIEHVSGRMAGWMKRQASCGNGRVWRLSQMTFRKELQ
jgi:hypothetical protein